MTSIEPVSSGFAFLIAVEILRAKLFKTHHHDSFDLNNTDTQIKASRKEEG